jgi:nucleoside-diphosphate kinase
MAIEKTLILLKPDAIQRGLIGKIIQRFEDTGLKLIGMKMLWPNKELAEQHYPWDETWAKNVFEKTKKSYEKDNKKIPYKDSTELGNELRGWLTSFLQEGPIIAIVLEGPHAIELTRKLVGATEPRQATPGTIRGDFASIESY